MSERATQLCRSVTSGEVAGHHPGRGAVLGGDTGQFGHYVAAFAGLFNRAMIFPG
jgi:hypothetical protein